VENIRKAEAVAIKYWKLGYAVICPHLNTALLDGVAPDEVWLKGDLEMLGRCDIVVMMKGWDCSKGATSEHNYAKHLGIQVIYDAVEGL
jgi:hypothetical protein